MGYLLKAGREACHVTKLRDGMPVGDFVACAYCGKKLYLGYTLDCGENIEDHLYAEHEDIFLHEVLHGFIEKDDYGFIEKDD